MANLKEIRTRINSVKSTRQMTSAMKMVAAAKLRKAQDRIIQLRPYAKKLQEILEHLWGEEGDRTQETYTRALRKAPSVLLVVITSNKGLCGAFNAQVTREALRLAEEEYSEQARDGRLKFYCIGKKGMEVLRKKGFEIYKYEEEILDDLTFERASVIAEELMRFYSGGTVEYVDLIYNQFKNAAVQVLAKEQFLPFQQDHRDSLQTRYLSYILEPSHQNIIEELTPKFLKIQFYKAVLDSYVAEHAARMTAMHQATDNASELIKELNLSYNKARQAAITSEILEVVSGAEALEK